MKPKIEVVNGVVKVSDADTGKPVTGVDTIDFTLSPDATPMCYLGFRAFAASLDTGPKGVAATVTTAPTNAGSGVLA